MQVDEVSCIPSSNTLFCGYEVFTYDKIMM